ncbi:hypothetical protein BKA64DRAFT_712145 [Cadophora sp. MPI-SDFR-AT-0126]|nr:hypothetical protein BKA64DRAFT_712145 [Leotiomycetes sp. MPI-SDFR-AT-0126]
MDTVNAISLEVFERAVIQARAEKSFWQKYRWYIIGGLAALPPQILLGWWYLRRRKAKKAALKRSEEETALGPYSNVERHR